MLEHSDQIISALKKKNTVDLIKSTLTLSYRHFFPQHEAEVASMINRSFELLGNVKDGSSLVEATRIINASVFHKDDERFWFNRLHRQYKVETRSQADFQQIAGDIAGKRILDFGSNGGYFALELEKHGYTVMTTDITDHRDASAKHLAFRQMQTPVDVPYRPDSADTVIVKTVFHHIDKANIPLVLGRLRSIAPRLIIKEDLYGVTEATPGLGMLIEKQQELRRFVNLTAVEQHAYLILIDYFGNVVAHGLTDMTLFFNFHTLVEWERILLENQYTIKKVVFYGFEDSKLHNSLQVWIVCDRI